MVKTEIFKTNEGKWRCSVEKGVFFKDYDNTKNLHKMHLETMKEYLHQKLINGDIYYKDSNVWGYVLKTPTDYVWDVIPQPMFVIKHDGVYDTNCGIR